jgi:anti-anti-sigma factor
LKLNLETRTLDDVTVLFCKGRLTYRDQAPVFSSKIADLLPHTRRLVLELSALETIDSASLGELVVVHMWARASGCMMKLAGANDHIRQLFERTHLISVLDVHPALDEALLSFREHIAPKTKAFHAA